MQPTTHQTVPTPSTQTPVGRPAASNQVPVVLDAESLRQVSGGVIPVNNW